MSATPWHPCPRCQSARVRYTPPIGISARLGLSMLGGFLALLCFAFGFAVPCLWVGVPIFGLWPLVVWFVRAPASGWHCIDCLHAWQAPPP